MNKQQIASNADCKVSWGTVPRPISSGLGTYNTSLMYPVTSSPSKINDKCVSWGLYYTTGMTKALYTCSLTVMGSGKDCHVDK